MLGEPPGAVDVLREQVTRLEAFERTGSPMRIRCFGLHLWPMIKYLLVKQTILAMATGFAPTDHYAAYARTLRRKGISQMRWRKRRRIWRAARTFDPGEPLTSLLPGIAAATGREPQAPVLLFGSASGFQNTSQGRVSVHHHAIRLELAKRGHRTLGIYSDRPEAADLAAFPAYGGGIDLDPLIRHITGTAPMAASAEAVLRRSFPQLEQVVARTGHPVGHLCAFADILTGRMVTATGVMSALLRRLQPQAVFLSNYASFHGWAMAHACRRARVPCIDIQHGVEGRHNGAYHWAASPWRDWNTVPTHHLAWTQADADLFTGQNRRRRAAVMGSHTRQFARLADATPPETLRALPSPRPVLLFTAQHARDILTARDLLRHGLTVIFRSHPTRRAETHALVEPPDLEALHCTLGSETALTTLLEHCDGMITGYSATILEAAELGKPVFATGAFAEILGEDYAATLEGLLTLDPGRGGPGLTDRLREWSETLGTGSNASRPDAPELGTALEILQAGL